MTQAQDKRPKSMPKKQEVPYRPELDEHLFRVMLNYAKTGMPVDARERRKLKEVLEASEYQVPLVDWGEEERAARRRRSSLADWIFDQR